MSSDEVESSRRAANLVIVFALIATVLCILTGVLTLQEGGARGWLFIGMAALPLLLAFVARSSFGGKLA